MRLLTHPTAVAQRVPLFSTAEIFLAVLVLISISNQKGSLALVCLFEIIAQESSFPFTAFSSTKTRKAEADHCSLSLDRL